MKKISVTIGKYCVIAWFVTSVSATVFGAVLLEVIPEYQEIVVTDESETITGSVTVAVHLTEGTQIDLAAYNVRLRVSSPSSIAGFSFIEGDSLEFDADVPAGFRFSVEEDDFRAADGFISGMFDPPVPDEDPTRIDLFRAIFEIDPVQILPDQERIFTIEISSESDSTFLRNIADPPNNNIVINGGMKNGEVHVITPEPTVSAIFVSLGSVLLLFGRRCRQS